VRIATDNGSVGPVREQNWAVRRVAHHLLDLIFPHQTLEGGPAVQSAGLSAEAWSRITFLDDPVCDGCGSPFEFEAGPGVRCPACEAKPRAFARARAACLYDENSRARSCSSNMLTGRILAHSSPGGWPGRRGTCWPRPTALAPVPLHPTRLFRRKYNQAAEIARPLSRLAGLTYLPDALVRRRATETQGASRAPAGGAMWPRPSKSPPARPAWWPDGRSC